MKLKKIIKAPLTMMPVDPIQFFGNKPMPNQIFGVNQAGAFTASRPKPFIKPIKPVLGIGIVPLIPRTKK